MSSETKCFQCGQAAGNPLRLNHMPNGTVCTTCRDRLLDSLPAPFPAAVAREAEPGLEQTAEEQHEESEAEVAESRSRSHLRPMPPLGPRELSDAGPSGPRRMADPQSGNDDFKPSA